MLRLVRQYIQHRINARRRYKSLIAELQREHESRYGNENFFTDIIDQPGKHRKKTEWNE